MAKNKTPIAKRCKALGVSPAVLGYNKKNTNRNSQNKMCVWPDTVHKAGDLVDVTVLSCTQATLRCELA